jgi:leucyl-tRNA synthetase
MGSYDHKSIESKWSAKWKEDKLYHTPDTSNKPKNYTLVMFPYPSGDLHIGHWYNFAPADIYARFMRMCGNEVLNPIGFDAFGLPAENAAIKRNIHPSDWTHANVKSMLAQLDKMGPSYDLNRIVVTCDPDYYKWTQWCFLKLFEKGLAYKTRAAANWCPTCKSVLANEQAEGGICWRCGSQVEQRMIEQWFFKITEYADRLLEGLDRIEWPEKIKLMQKNWIGKSNGAEIKFKVEGVEEELTVFTTRPDTIFGATFVVLAPEHSQVPLLTTEQQKRDINTYIEQTTHKSELERIADQKKKTGAFTGSYAIHPITGQKLPIWIADFVLATYGTGAIMAVPAHDDRDYDFAKQFDLPIKFVLQPSEVTGLVLNNSVAKEFFDELLEHGYKTQPFSSWGTLINFSRDKADEFQHMVQTYLKDGPHFVHTDGVVRTAIFKDKVVSYNTDERSWREAIEYGESKKIISERLDFTFPEEGFESHYADTENAYLVDSESFSGLESADAKKLIVSFLEKENKAKAVTKYKLRDWLVSRQRYWGPPVPIIYCDTCGIVPVPLEQLPVLLPYDVDYTPKETSPLGSSENFVKTACPKCGEPASRDTDTLDTFVDSSWYFLRYPSASDDAHPFASAKLTKSEDKVGDRVNYWLPVDKYIGGTEHAVLHLLYSRFMTKFFYDQEYLNFDEPFKSLFNQGTILGPDGQKMSKSKGNVINPDELVEHYGADTVRIYLCFLGPYDQGGEWNPSGIEGAARFVRKFYSTIADRIAQEPSEVIEVALNKLIKKVTSDIPNMKFNTSIAAFMEFTNTVGQNSLTQSQKERIIRLIAPFTPFLAEELWNKVIGATDSIHLQPWPTFDESLLIESTLTIPIQVDGKVRDRVVVPAGSTAEYVVKAALGSEIVQKFVPDQSKINPIYIQDRLLNIVNI